MEQPSILIPRISGIGMESVNESSRKPSSSMQEIRPKWPTITEMSCDMERAA